MRSGTSSTMPGSVSRRACAPANRTGRTLHAGANNGGDIRTRSPSVGWCSSMRSDHGALRVRWTDQPPQLPGLCGAVPGPSLRPGDIVVMDNLGSHKGAAVRHAIRATGAKLFFLPPYSPDLNPIEQMFASSRRCCAGPQPAQSRQPGGASANCSPSSHQTNAPTTSSMPAMRQPRQSCSRRTGIFPRP